MKSKKLVTVLVLGTLALAVAFGAVAYRSASAQSTTPAAPTTTGNTTTAPSGKGFPDGADQEYLAKALGITVDELTAAYQKANDAALAKAVEQGLITQAQADQLKTTGKAVPFGGRRAEWLSQSGIDFESLLAAALGISVEQLQAAELQAQNARIDQAVIDGNLTQDQSDLMKGRNALYGDATFQASMKTAFETAVQQAVSSGVITQTQADLVLKEYANMKGIGMGFGGPQGMDGFGGRHGHGRRAGGHGGEGMPFAPGTGQAPSTTP